MTRRFLFQGCGVFSVLLATTYLTHPTAADSQSALQARGRIFALVVFAQFADEGSAQDAPPSFADDLFDPDVPGSLTHFIDEMSHGQFQLEGRALPRWYRSDGAAASYLASEAGVGGEFGRFVREILEAADADTDLAEFDNDGPDGVPDSGDDDGFVDLVFVITRSTPPGFIITQATGLARLGLLSAFVTNDRTIDGRTLRIRADSSTPVGGVLQRGKNFAEAVGSMAHEFGHVLGLPDLFDTDFNSLGNDMDPAQDSAGIGYWGLMGHGTRGWDDAGGPNPLSAWSLEQLGWVGPANEHLVTLDEDAADLAFEDEEGHSLVYKLPGPSTEEGPSPVYYLVEHRRPGSSYYERDLPGSGLIIWRVDEEARGHRNTVEQVKLVDLVCADGLFDDAGAPIGQTPEPDVGGDNLDFWAHDPAYTLEHAGNLGDEGDLFDGEEGADEFSVVSNPAAPAGRGLVIEAIRRQGNGMRADVRFNDRRRAGRIDENQVWRDTIEVVGDVRVGSAATLTVAPGTVVLMGPDQRAAGLDASLTELVVFGTLFVAGGQTGAVFTSAAQVPSPGDWYGIRTSFGSLRLNRVALEYASTALSGNLGVSVDTPERMDLVTVREASGDGLDLRVRGRVELDRVVVVDAGGTGMRFSGDGQIHMEECEVSGAAVHGLAREAGSTVCTNCRFLSNGVLNTEAANLLLASRARVTITEGTFTGGIGIRLERAGDVLIRGTQFNDHRTAVITRDTQLQFERNWINNCDLAFQTTGVGARVLIALNSIEGTPRLIENTNSFPVVAGQNWWGRDDESWIEERMIGLVEWRPVLNFDPRIPVDFALNQNFPNPFNASTVIDYSVGIRQATGDMTLEIRDAVGGLVRRLVDGPAVPGIYSVTWDGMDGEGEAAASGTYFYLLEVGGNARLSRKLMVIR